MDTARSCLVIIGLLLVVGGLTWIPFYILDVIDVYRELQNKVYRLEILDRDEILKKINILCRKNHITKKMVDEEEDVR